MAVGERLTAKLVPNFIPCYPINSMSLSSLFSKVLSLGVFVGAMLAATVPTRAVTVNWKTDLPGMSLFQSNGSTLDASFKFELGTLDSGPVGLTVSTVDDNWNVIEQEAANSFAIRPSGNVFAQYDSELTAASATQWQSTHAPFSLFNENTEMFVLVHNGFFSTDTGMWATEPTQWAILKGTAIPGPGADAWVLPGSPGTHVWNITMFMEDATIEIGNLTVVPEPSVSLLFLLATGGWALRRRRC